MSSNADLIEERIATIMADESTLDGLTFYLGVPYEIPIQDYSVEHEAGGAAIVVVNAEDTLTEFTGNRVARAYYGIILIEVIQQDIPAEVTSRIKRVPSYRKMRNLCEQVIRLFKATAYRDLNELTFDNGRVDTFTLGRDQIEYGEGAESPRTNSMVNYAQIPFSVETTETM